jgi:poly(beta-D-mannuronate) lyase
MFRLACVLVVIGSASAATRTVATPAELDAALAAVAPGDTILLADGTWKDARITVSTERVTVRAATPGKVVLTGASTLTLAAPHVTVEGLRFEHGAIPKGSVISFRSDHGRLADTAIVDYNPPDLATAYYWIFFEGNDNTVERCLLAQKNHMGPLIGNAIKDARRNTVVRCHIRDIGSSHGKNGMEDFRIWGYGGNEELGDDGAFFTIDSNLFERADGESMEIVSLKSNRNRVVNNTIRATLGGITNRSGNFNTIANNVILCEGRKGAYGMRITGQHQRVEANYIQGCDTGITLMAGEFIDRDLTGKYDPVTRAGTPLGRVPRYNQPRETEIVHNIFVDNTGADLILGGGYKSGWPASQRVLLPEANRIAENVIVRTGGAAVDTAKQDTAPPLDAFHFEPNRLDGNRIVSDKDVPRPAVPTTLTAKDVGPRWR